MNDFFSKRDQIRSFLQIWSHLLRKSLMENFIFCTVLVMGRCGDNSKLFTKAAHLNLGIYLK